MNISVNNKQWTRVQLSAGFSCLTPQTQGGFYYSRTDLGTDVSNLGKRLDVVSFSSPLGVNLTAPIDIWVLSTEDEGILSYENEIVSGAKVIFVNTGGGTGPGGTYTFNNPLSETGGNVNLNFDTNGLKLQNGRLTLDLTTDPNFTFVQNEIADINQDINALEAQDTIFTNNIASINTKIGNATLQTTSKDLSGAVNELNNKINQSSLTFSLPLLKSNNNVSLSFDSDLKLNAQGNKLTLNLNANNDFRNVLLGLDEAKKIANYSQLGRIMPIQGHFDINSLNGELRLDLSPTGVLSTNFAQKTIESKVNQAVTDIARLNTEVSDLDNQVNLLKTGKADSSDLQALEVKVTANEGGISQLQQDLNSKADSSNVYLKTETYSQQEVDDALLLKADKTSLNSLSQKVDNNKAEITQNTNKIQTLESNYTTLSNQSVKTTNTAQDIDGLKKFLKELEANNFKAKENGADYGAIDIRNQDGYFSISEDGGSAGVTKLAALGFVDSTTTFRIRNLTGGVVTFNTLAQYESTLTPTDDKDLVHVAYVRQIKEELENLIQSLQGGIHFVGVISNSKQECETNPQLLTNFVQTQESRTPRNGDFIKTNDSFGFIYNGTNWINFGQVSISIATTTTAGIMMFGTTDGELQDLGNGKAKVIGWDTVKQALTSLDGRITANTQSINQNTQSITQNTQSISTLDGQAVKLTGNQSIGGNKVFTSKLEIDADNEVLKLKNSSNTSNYIAGYEGNTRIYYIGKDSSSSIDLSIKNEHSINGWITLKTKSKFDQAYTITDNEQIVHKKYVDDTINTNCVKLTGNQTIAGDKTFSGFSNFNNAVDVDTPPSSISNFIFRFIGDRWSSGQSADLIRFHKFGAACGYRVYLNGTSFGYVDIWGLTLISNMKDPTADAHGANVRWVKGYALPKVTTNAVNTIQVSNSASKYFNFDYVIEGSGYRNWSGIQLRAKRDAGSFETMWKIEYRDENNLGLFMECIGNKLNFESDTKIVGVSCEDSDGEKTAASKKYVDGKTGDLSQLSTTAKGNLVESINEVSTGISSKAGLTSNNNFTGQNTFPKATAPTQALTSQSLFYPAGTNPQDIPNGMGGFILNNP